MYIYLISGFRVFFINYTTFKEKHYKTNGITLKYR